MDKLERLQLDIAALLRTIPALQYTKVVEVTPRIDADGNLVTAPQIESLMNMALNGVDLTNGKAGTLIQVLLPEEDLIDHKMRGTELVCTASVELEINENMLVNRGDGGGLRTCTELANDVFDALHGYILAGAIIEADDKRTKRLLQYQDGTLGCVLRFNLDWERLITERVQRISLTATSNGGGRILSEDGGRILTESGANITNELGAAGVDITLSTDTSGASIYYTTDGSFPSEDNTAATLYSGSFTITTECTLRAVAFKSGLNPSPLREVAINPQS